MSWTRNCRILLLLLLLTTGAGCGGSGAAGTTDGIGTDTQPMPDVRADEADQPGSVVFKETVEQETTADYIPWDLP